MVDILFTYDTPVPLSYGDAYLEAARKLESQGITHACLNLAEFVNSYDFSDEYLQETADKLKPKLIISHHRSLEKSLANYTPPFLISTLMEEIETFFVRRFLGRINTDTPYDSINRLESKEGFVKVMRAHGLPHPKSILRDEISPEQWDYDYLSQELGQQDKSFLLKNVRLQVGRGISYVNSPDKMLYDEDVKVAQTFLENCLSTPLSLRVTTFHKHIIGAFLIYNTIDKYRSNCGGNNIVTLKTNHSCPSFMIPPNFYDEIEHFGVNPDLTLQEGIVELVDRVTSIPSQSLNRGIDIIFDKNSTPCIIEAQPCPGNPCCESYPLMAGIQPELGSSRFNFNIAAEVLSKYMYNFLQTH